MSFKLVIQSEHNSENVAPTDQEWETEVVIGRGEASGFRLSDRRKLISSRHAKITRQGNDFVLIDIGSTNGTTLNGRRIQVGTPCPLAAHDRIGIGEYVLEFVPVDTSTPSDEENTDATLCVLPVEVSSFTIVERLKKRYAELLPVPADEREAELVKILQETISGLKKEKSEEILSMVEQAFSEEEVPTENVQQRDLLSPAEVSEGAASLNDGPASAIKLPISSSLDEREEQVLTLLLDFVLDSIRGRRQFEKELEVEVTRIFGKERSPIKWAETSQELRTYLFESGESNNEFPQILKELQLVLEDLALHPVGLMAGFRECVRFFLKQLDPLTLEIESKHKKKDLGSWLLSLGVLGSHPTWEYFKEKHRQLREEEIKTFHRLLGPEFAKGYLRVYQQTKSS